MRILLTNDDGIHAPGLLALRAALRALGSVTVVAPDRERSAVSHSLSLYHPIVIRRQALSGRGPAFAVDGTPVDCVKLALSELCRERPELIVSGMNPGLNTGINIIYSGTVGAATEGVFAGIAAAAVSLQASAVQDFRGAARLAARLIGDALAARRLRPGRLLNINIPAVRRPRGVRWTVMERGATVESYVRRADPRGRIYFWIKGPDNGVWPGPRDLNGAVTPTDNAAVLAGYVSITPLQFDLTDRATLAEATARRPRRSRSSPR